VVIVCVRFGGGGPIKGVEGKGYLAGDRVWGSVQDMVGQGCFLTEALKVMVVEEASVDMSRSREGWRVR
jgi:hypothetical protein